MGIKKFNETSLDQMLYVKREPFELSLKNRWKCPQCQKVNPVLNIETVRVQCSCGLKSVLTTQLTQTIFAKEYK